MTFCGGNPILCSPNKPEPYRGVQKFEKGGRNFLFPFPLKISVKTKKKVFTSFDVLRCPVFTVPLTGDIYQLIF